MSVASQITRLTGFRDRLRTKLVSLGIVSGSAKLEDCTEAVEEIPAKAGQTYTPGTQDQVISAGQYLTGSQTVKGDSNLIADNIADGVTVFGIVGTHVGGVDTSDATLTSGGQMLDGITAYARGTKVTGTIETYDGTLEQILPYSVLQNNPWDTIGKIARAGIAGNYWAVGDTKSVALSGTVGTLALDTTLYVYIIGINHRNVNGITFQGFKTVDSGMIDVCLVSNYDSKNTAGSLAYFTMNHWGGSGFPYNTNYGGWKGCDARYDLLGSTNVPPSGYGATPTTSRVGYDAGTTTATNPVSNTLMSCLPSDLRAVMRPMTIYTNNIGNSNDTAAGVTASVDYLALLAEFEIFGVRTFANQYEKDNQTQYAYYSAGNSKIKYRHSNTGSSAVWWERSPYYGDESIFCDVNTSGKAVGNASRSSYGFAPAFMV